MAIGVYSLSNNAFDVLIMAVFGIVGYICSKLECEPAPMILGFILGPLMEENLRRAMCLSRGARTVVFTHPDRPRVHDRLADPAGDRRPAGDPQEARRGLRRRRRLASRRLERRDG